MTPPQKPIRWTWAVGILLVSLVALTSIWTRDIPRQDRVLGTGITLIVTSLLLYLWAILLSRFPRRTRFRIFLVGLLVITVAASSVRITGVTGDMVPILGFRWTSSKTVTNERKSSTNSITRGSFSQFLGNDRNGIIPNLRLDTNWTARPPQLLWTIAVGPSWSGFSISDGRAYTMEQRAQDELLTCYDLQSGRLLWSHIENTRYFTTIGGEGPRTVPTIHGDKIFAFGAAGILICVDRTSGKLIWRKDMVKEHVAKVPDWGFASSPLIHKNGVIINVGGVQGRSLVAHDLETGAFLWGGGDDSAGYSSPTLLSLAGSEQIVTFVGKSITSHNPTNGSVLWRHPWPTGTPHVTMPIQISTNRLLGSQGYGHGSELLEITRTNNSWNVERIWKSNRLKSKFANLILHNGYVYGLDDGILTCLDPNTGERKWHGERYGHGQLLLVSNSLLLTSEKGDICLFEPSPEAERLITCFPTLKGKMWNPPALAGDFLLLRNAEQAACYRLPIH